MEGRFEWHRTDKRSPWRLVLWPDWAPDSGYGPDELRAALEGLGFEIVADAVSGQTIRAMVVRRR